MPLARHTRSIRRQGKPWGLLVVAFFLGLLPSLFFLDTAASRDATKARGLTLVPPQGAQSLPVPETEEFIEGNYWALIVGINKYPALDNDKQLTAARKDAERVAGLLIDRYGFSREHMIELYDEKASLKGIIHAFSELKRRLSDKDSLFIYYAGHGAYEGLGSDRGKADKVGYWIPSNGEREDPSSYIFNSLVRDYLAKIPARHIYLVVDSYFQQLVNGADSRPQPRPRRDQGALFG